MITSFSKQIAYLKYTPIGRNVNPDNLEGDEMYHVCQFEQVKAFFPVFLKK